MAQIRPEFHHYIPRFILKTFADNFKLNTKDDFIANATDVFKATDPDVQFSNNQTSAQKNRGGKKGKKKRQSKTRYHVNVYQVEDHATVLSDVGKIYGEDDMYRDINEEDCMKFEKLLSKFESSSSKFIRDIWAGNDLSLTRSQLDDMKKFLAIMTYRGEHRRGQYYDENFDMMTLMSIKRHMSDKNMKTVQEVWLNNLKWLIETSIEDIVKEYIKASNIASRNPFALMNEYSGPIHVTEMMDFIHMVRNYMCVWEAEEGSEFILAEGCFGSYEGDRGICFHSFFVVSPRYAIVLVNRQHMWGKMGHRESWFGDHLHAMPETVYKNAIPLRTITQSDYSADDVFKYRRIKVPKQEVYIVNSIFLDARLKYLTYKSSVCMYKTLRYYDKIKKRLFHHQHDYSILRRKIVADLNRTHAS